MIPRSHKICPLYIQPEFLFSSFVRIMTSANQSPISTLKVDFHCSKQCAGNVKKLLQQFQGVESISIDPKQGLVTVIGKVNPMMLVKLVQKTGQRAELVSFQKAPMTYSGQNTTNFHTSHRCCDKRSSSSTSDSDSDSDDDNEHRHHHSDLVNIPQVRKKSSSRRPPNFPRPPPITTYDSAMHWMKYARTPAAPHAYCNYNRMPPYGLSSWVSGYYNPMIQYGNYAYPF